MKIKKNIALSSSGFLFNPTTGDSFTLNPIAQQVLKFMQLGRSEEDIINAILEGYRIDRDTVEKDFYDFKNMLQVYHLLESEEE